MKAALNKTELQDRTLWFDGDSTFSSSKLAQFIQLGAATSGWFVDEITPDIAQFNKLVLPDEQIRIKEGIRDLDFSWNIPEEYKNLDVQAYVVNKLSDRCDELPEEEWNARALRVSQELGMYKYLELFDVLRTIIYIINTLDSKKVVWGVGRGSSVSSYVLYLIGVHDVDSVKYELDINDFLRVE